MGVFYKLYCSIQKCKSIKVSICESTLLTVAPTLKVKNTQIQKRLGEGLRLEQPNTMSDELYEVLLKVGLI